MGYRPGRSVDTDDAGAGENRMNDTTCEDLLRRMLAWRRAALNVVLGTAVAGAVYYVVELRIDIDVVTSFVLIPCMVLYLLGGLFMMIAIPVIWYHVIRTAWMEGGTFYALECGALAILLTPALLLGVLLGPVLVASDIRKGYAGWRKLRYRSGSEWLLRSLSGIVGVLVGFAVGTGAWILVGALWGVLAGALAGLLTLRILNLVANRLRDDSEDEDPLSSVSG